jgi:putative ABC transport system ATP-binding protein/lipoprotein-releasing system ATP-binding protein
VDGLTVRYGARTVLDGLSLEVYPGESMALTGASGCGKSTLLSAIIGFTKPMAGEVSICGTPMRAGLSRSATRLRREKIGAVFQDGHLLDELTALENIQVAGLLAGMAPGLAENRARALLERFGLPKASRPVTSLSGGERQRVSVARALVNDPQLVVADEPTGSLDPTSRDEVTAALFSIPRESPRALLVVTHDPAVAERADKVRVLRDGRLAQVHHGDGARDAGAGRSG